MLSSTSISTPIGLLLLGISGALGDVHRLRTSSCLNESTILETIKSSTVTYIEPTTRFSETTVPITHYVDVTVSHYVDVTVSHYVNVTVSSTETVSTCITESTTTTLHYTVSVTETDSATITQTQTTTATVPATITTYTTQTIISTTVDPCPTTCSISAGTVNLFFWPTDRPFTYPSTYVDTALGYTFTSPSVYMMIPTAKGTNSLGPAGPSTSKWILPLDLEEVSTIIDGTITRQLTLSDLGTDCPQTADPTAIATMVDPRCDPILAAPKQVSSWANPCNACGRFGLFDPPYAVPTITGGLFGTPTPVLITTTVVPPPTIVAPAPTSAPPVGTAIVVYYVDGKPVSTATVPTTGVSGVVTSSVNLSLTGITTQTSSLSLSSPSSVPSSAPSSASSSASSTLLSTKPSTSASTSTSTSTSISTTTSATATTTPSTSLISSPSAPATTSVITASATKLTGGIACLISSIFMAVYIF